MGNLLTKKDLAERWQLTTQAIDNYIKDGIVVPVKGIPSVRFNPQYIEKIEGCIPEKTTMKERKLERELEEVKKERDYLREILGNILAESSKVISTTKVS